MAKVILGMAMSLDGFINDRSGRVGALYPDLNTLGNTERMRESIRNTGAVAHLRIDMRGPDGVVYPMKRVFHEIVEPERLVCTSRAFEDEKGNPQLARRVSGTRLKRPGECGRCEKS